MILALALLVLTMLVNIVLTLSVVGALGTSQMGLIQHIQFQARTTRRALVELLDPEELTEEQKTLDAIVASPVFREAVDQDAEQSCMAYEIDWFGERKNV